MVDQEALKRYAQSGLSLVSLAALCKMDLGVFLEQHGEDVKAWRAQAAYDILDQLSRRAKDELVKGDLKAMTTMIDRLDPTPTEAAPAFNLNLNLPPAITNLKPEDINRLMWSPDEQE